MAWFGRIDDFRLQDDKWLLVVSYYDDATPDKTIRRSMMFPLTVTRPEVVAQVKAIGLEVKRVTTFNSENVIGTIIPIN